MGCDGWAFMRSRHKDGQWDQSRDVNAGHITEAMGRNISSNYSILLILLLTKILLPVSFGVKVKGYTVTCQAPLPPSFLPALIKAPDFFAFPQEVPRPFPPHRLCSSSLLCSFSRYLLASALLSFRSLLKCHLMTRPSQACLLRITDIQDLHLFSHIILSYEYLLNECISERKGDVLLSLQKVFHWIPLRSLHFFLLNSKLPA